MKDACKKWLKTACWNFQWCLVVSVGSWVSSIVHVSCIWVSRVSRDDWSSWVDTRSVWISWSTVSKWWTNQVVAVNDCTFRALSWNTSKSCSDDGKNDDDLKESFLLKFPNFSKFSQNLLSWTFWFKFSWLWFLKDTLKLTDDLESNHRSFYTKAQWWWIQESSQRTKANTNFCKFKGVSSKPV